MSKPFLGMALASLLVMSCNAFADDLFRFDNPGGVIWANVYVNPYSATDLTKNEAMTIYCDDWNSDFSGSPSWYATVTALTDVDTLLGNLKYGSSMSYWNVKLDGTGSTAQLSKTVQHQAPSPRDRYLEAAWLDNQWRTGAVGTDRDTQIELAAAVWLLFANNDNAAHLDNLINAINSSNYAADVFGYLQAAQKAVPNWDASGWSVITPNPLNEIGGNQTIRGANMQEFLVYSTPEPSAVILLGTVIGYLGLTRFRRTRRA